jgi:hypothetical protein
MDATAGLPADPSVVQSTKFELVLTQGAKALGLAVPETLATADEVIQWKRRTM